MRGAVALWALCSLSITTIAAQALKFPLQPALKLDDVPSQYRPIVLPKPSFVLPKGEVNEGHGWFHWVIPTCPTRKNWSRFLSSLLLSAAYNGIHSYSVTLVLCNTYNASAPLPALLYNLQYSQNVNIIYPSESFPINSSVAEDRYKKQYYWRTAVTCLLVPAVLNASHLPLFMTEDDVLFSPRAQASLAAAVYQVTHDIPPGAAFYLNTYAPLRTPGIDTGTVHQIDQPGATAEEEGKGAPFQIKPEIHWGFQGVMISSGMAEMLVKHFNHITSSPLTDDLFVGHADWIVMTYMRDTLKCNQKGASCFSYRLSPSLVQHMGTTSATFQNGNLNHLFHVAADYPVRVKFPGLESQDLWRKH